MKRILSLCLVTALLLLSANAFAEAVATESPIEVAPVENGTVVPFTDYNFQITLPSDWNVLEVSEDQTASGIIFNCTNPENTRSFTVAYTEFETPTDYNTVAEALASSYQNVQELTINDMPFISYNIAENDVTGIVTLGASGVGMYQFVFYPASDEEYGPLALQIAASIKPIQ